VAHTCNPNYSGGRDQEDCGLKPPGQIVLETLFKKKKPSQKRAGRVVQAVTLPSKDAALSTNSNTVKKKKIQREIVLFGEMCIQVL
jgi:hypothetical protein